MNARVYDPDIGRFLSPDPTVPGVHNPQAFNRYAYAFNSPLNLIDPDGFEPRAPDGSFADGGYRGANSGPANNTGNQGTAAAANAIGSTTPAALGGDNSIPGMVATNPVPEADEKLGLFGWIADKVQAFFAIDAVNKTLQGLLPGVSGAIKAVGPAVKTAQALNKVDDAAKMAAAAKVNAKVAQEAEKNLSKIFSKDKQALVDMAKKDKKEGITKADLQAYKDLNKELTDAFPSNKVRGPEAHKSGLPSSQEPHAHIGPVNHVPVKP